MENSLETTLINYYEEWEDNTQVSRDDSERNRDYYDNKQHTGAEKKALNERKQPVVTFNLVKRTIDALKGLERENRTDPKALPRTPQHEDDADSATDSIRFVCDNNDFDQIASEAFGSLLIEGVEIADVQIIPRNNRLEVGINGVPWDRGFWDVHSRRNDFEDAKYKGIVIWMDWEDANDQPGWDKDVLKTAIAKNENPHNETHEDKPTFKWNDHQRKRVKICYIHYKVKGRWNFAYFTEAGILKGGKEIPYVDEYGIPQSTLVFQSAFVDREGNRYSYTQSLISPQDEVNKRRSKALHHINVRQTFGNQRAGLDQEQVRNELAKPDGHVDMQSGEFGKDFGIIPTTDMTAGNLQLLVEAKEAFNVVGANTSVTGKEDRVMSGRAEIVRQQAGFRELAPVMDAHSHWKKRIYKHVWNLIRQYWDDERWVRVTDDPSNMRWVGVNRRITKGELIAEDLKNQGDEQALAQLQQQMQIDPRLHEEVVMNRLSELEVDITVEEAPDIANIQQEQFELVANLYQANPQGIPFESIIELSSLRNKEQLLEKIKGNQEAQEQAAQQAQEQNQIDKAEQLAGIDKTVSETEKNNAATEQTRIETRLPLALSG